MELTVNGVGRSLPDAATVADLVGEVTADRRGVAVAVNGEVVPRTGWPGTTLRDGDRVEVLSAAQGG
ncbi:MULTISPECIES: sulfur carrier protein ThiS [Micromonospora]|uniref:Sulfur carrier protein ThiS n=2 Tax=Micromonospora TaxID=1873 RepID=A0A1C6R9T0_9ACTN|nr:MULTISPECIES: sulfur carrier protein ThiS [Micromonospora]TWJ27110.1 sulfur carrier protein ThiS [Micromonospora sagamiensis]BCL13998.1 thiamine biosynthesis protein ThiS [Micromonospora sagamiensis]SCL13880.1 sulfur carrier protein ThiS [Micromonospora inyonensis]